MSLRPGTIYVAPADHHLLISKRCFELSAGPSENGHRPAIDPLFCSAALTYGPSTIGVVLSGARDDGTAGLIAISRRGGRAVVQDPADALHSSMPANALHHVRDALIRPATELGKTISELTRSLPSNGHDEPDGDKRDEIETRIAAMEPVTTTALPDARPSGLSCPTCHGVLYELSNQPAPRFRCRVGHAWSPQALRAGQEDAADQALWTALRTLEEAAEFNRRLAEDARRGGRSYSVAACLARAARAESDAAQIRRLLDRGSDDAEVAEATE
jgi:two-component system chemotaxis response regulator CheB